MNPIKWLYEDLKGDIVFLWKVITGKVDLEKKTNNIFNVVKEGVKEKGFWSNYLKDNWFWILFAILTFCIGLWFGSIYYGNKCNSVLIKAIAECTAYYTSSDISSLGMNWSI